MLASIRRFFSHRDVLEVETPLLSRAGNPDPNLESLTVIRGEEMYYLHTSPEFPMKRLLAAGSGSIYQICKVFRGGERGRLHNPEFTMLEWYRVGMDYYQLMDDVVELLGEVCGYTASDKLTYADAFQKYTGIDVLSESVVALQQYAASKGLTVCGLSDADIDAWRDLILTHFIEPQLGRERPVFIYRYPASQAALARLCPDDPRVAERFELYINGMEIANGYHELTDAVEQRSRWQSENARRADRDVPEIPLDNNMLSALEAGLPNCSGVALGVDRLLMASAGRCDISEILSFSANNA